MVERRIEAPLLVLHADPGFRARLKAAAGDYCGFRVTASWEDLRAAVTDLPASAVVVVDPNFGTERSLARGVRRLPAPALYSLIDAFPSIAVIAAVQFTAPNAEEIRRLGEFGVSQVIGVGHDDTAIALEWHLREARGQRLRSLIERVLPADLPGRAHVILVEAIDITIAGERGQDLSDRLGLSPKGLLRWCARAGLPPPRRLLAWIRILLAAELLDDPGRQIGQVAKVAGYHSDPALRRVTRNFVGMSPTEMREKGAFRVAAKAFRAELESLEEGRNPLRGL